MTTDKARVQWSMKSVVGPVFIVASESGICGIYLDRQPVPMAKGLSGASPEIKSLARAVDQLEEYFRGERHAFDLPLDVEGTEFQKKVWKELSRIPYGRTVSYKEIARKIKNENAVRAVGSANGRNPLCIVVPCHRVIAADGSLGGYSGGLAVKKKLLAIEKAALEKR